MSRSDDYDLDADTLYEETSVEQMGRWIEDCEENAEVPLHRGGTSFTEWERDFLNSIREQYDARVAENRKKPLSGKQLVVLKRIWDRI